MGWGQLNQLLMQVILMPCIGVVMSKSRRMARVLLTNGVVGLDFNAWGLYLVVVEGFEVILLRCLVYVSTGPYVILGI
jgi:hypothetical protein